MLLHREEAARANEDSGLPTTSTARPSSSALRCSTVSRIRQGSEGGQLVTSGAGAAALACLDLLVMLGVPVENIWVTDIIRASSGEGRVEDMDEIKARYAKKTDARTLGEIIADADVFLGLSAGGVLKAEMVAKMAARPLILALANPHPEILPEDVKSVRDDAIICTGRSDYPNQVNNVLCFPFIFRGALDVGATTITEEMKLAAVKAIAELGALNNPTLSPRPTAKDHQLRPRVPDPQALRPAPDRQDRARRRPRRNGIRCGDATDRRLRCLHPESQRVRHHPA